MRKLRPSSHERPGARLCKGDKTRTASGISSVENSIQVARAEGNGIRKIAAEVGVGVGTVNRVADNAA